MKLSQSDIVKEYYINRPNQDIKIPDVVDWVVSEWNRRTGGTFRDPDRCIRKLAQSGFLIKVAKGIYRYDPDFVQHRELEDFTPEQKEIIMKRDGYRCVICGRGRDEGVELQVDHIRPKEFGGKATIENGQTLCAQHNFLKKTLNQTTTGKKMFIRLYELAKAENNKELLEFTSAILEVFEKFNMNGHIVWKK